MEKAELVKLVRGCQKGDPDAQSALIPKIQNNVYYQCLKFLHRKEDAEDATQDILLDVLLKIDTLKEPEAFWGWLNRMTANHCKNLLRKTGELQIPEDEEGNSLLDTYETLDEQMVPDKALDNEETRRMIIEMIDALPAPQRMCVIMYYYNEMSVKDMAAALEVSENTIKSRLNYARKSIKEGAEKYEKQGIKLYGMSPLPLLLYFLRKDAIASALGAEACQAMADSVLTAAGSTAAASGSTAAASSVAADGAAETSVRDAAAASSAEDAALKTGLIAAVKGASLTTKLVAGVLSAAVVFGCGGVLLNTTSETNTPPSSIVNIEPQHPFIERIDRENAFYTNLIDLDGDGVEELLAGILVDNPRLNKEFPDVRIYWIDGRRGTFSYSFRPDEEQVPEEWAIYRHTETGDLWLGRHYVRDVGFAYDFSKAVDTSESEAHVTITFRTSGNTHKSFWYRSDKSDNREITEAEYNTLLAQFEVLFPLPFSSTTQDFTQFRYTVDEVRQDLETDAN